ncbi:TPA: hypothetical protein RUX44_000717 [Aeromonas hydrophila]|uniref:hypothetical protein n=1 Tax=Aeromonas hydrophila TaxID=644 RepID=UPI0028D96C5E|nr:hypothetical protein [Aeromonas hydrophila]
MKKKHVLSYNISFIYLIMTSCAYPYDNVVVPIPSVEMEKHSTCKSWSAKVIYTATLMPANIIDQLTPMGSFSTGEHFHVNQNPNGGSWLTTEYLEGTNINKLEKINYNIFRSENPEPGMQAFTFVSHGGSCAADEGLKECVGVFVHPSTGNHVSLEPTTFPFGACAGIPPTNVSCEFEPNATTIDLGTGGPGNRVGKGSIRVMCTGNTEFRIQAIKSTPGTDNGISGLDIRLEGQPLPYIGMYDGQESYDLNVDVSASVHGEGVHITTSVLRIDVL